MEFIRIIELLTYLYPIILAIGLIIGICYYKSLDSIHKNLPWYFFLMLAADLWSFYYGTYISNNNLIILIILSLVEMLAITYFYYTYLLRARHIIISGLIVISTLYILWEIVNYRQDATQFQSYAKVIDNFTVIILTLTFFHERINRYKDLKWENFRLNAIILGYFSINLIFFLPINFLINETTGLKFYFWFGNLIITIIFYFYLTILIWQNARSHAKIKP